MRHNVITPAKANQLFWLGRYAERVYLSLHFLRRYYDRMIDYDRTQYYNELRKRLDVNRQYSDNESFRLGYMYDRENPGSLMASLAAAHDNAILMREELSSETLAYIQMSLQHLLRSADKKESNITDLQCITDYLLAFWGSVDERIYDNRVVALLHVGRLLESLDMHVRFDYPFHRVKDIFSKLNDCVPYLSPIFNKERMDELGGLLEEKDYEDCKEGFKSRVLGLINGIVKI